VAEPNRFWDQLLQLIEEGKVVPVIGQDLLTVPPDTGHTHLYPYLAARLASYLDVSDADLPIGDELNEVAWRYVKQGNPAQDVYAALMSVARESEALPVPAPLLQLAEIPKLDLFVSTSFDGSMTRALNERRFGGLAKSRVFAHAPGDVQDLPGDWARSGAPAVYHLMGKLSATPTYAVTQEDLIEFFHCLQSDRRPKDLFHELNGRSLLLLGNRLSGWLTSFLMRMSKEGPLSSDRKTDYVADGLVSGDHGLVLFLERYSKATRIYSKGDPVAFVDELHQRWMARHPRTPAAATQASSGADAATGIGPGAVFLSYASGDAAAVERLRVALDKAGVDVFFDKEQLQAGDQWEAKLRRSISRCSLFVPVISRETLTPDRRFFRKEWNLALEEAMMASFSPDEAFLLPVVIDDTPIDHPELPARFGAAQWTKLPGGEATALQGVALQALQGVGDLEMVTVNPAARAAGPVDRSQDERFA